jgi:hypothetical protein
MNRKESDAPRVSGRITLTTVRIIGHKNCSDSHLSVLTHLADLSANMTDRFISSAWWLSVMAMICVTGTLTMGLSYSGVFELIAARWITGAAYIAFAIIASAATLQLCRCRNDLLEA